MKSKRTGRAVAIIQARMGSSRLAGKVLADIAGRPLLDHVVSRTARAIHVDDVVVATTILDADEPIVELCRSMGVRCHRGDAEDVLDRYRTAAADARASTVVRVTADCPLLDPAVVDRVITRFERGDVEYVSNVLPPTFPDGLDTEVFSIDALERSWHEARLMSEREHVTPYMRKHPEVFPRANVSNTEDLSSLRWTVDEPRDLLFIREVFRRLGDHQAGMSEVLALLREHPDLMALNAGIERDAGYKLSLKNDRTL